MNTKSAHKLKKLINNCKNSCDYFIEKFCRVKHPTAGEIGFNLFKYQKHSIRTFQNSRFVLFSKTRQCGISTLVGAYALWYIMFFKNKTVLVVSKSERGSKEFLNKNVKFVFRHLPKWMQEVWRPTTDNEHELGFSSGSKITCLPAGPEVLRQYSSSLNIIDEAAFMRDMDSMWAAGYPTMIHGGRCIVISTSNGVGNWYWQNYMDAKAGHNDFSIVEIDWWEMDWIIEYRNPDGTLERISPTDEIRRCNTEEEKNKYGPYWSPWLEEQYRQLTQMGGDRKFRQEVLRDFVGSGNTVIRREDLVYIGETISDDYQMVDMVEYVHPNTGDHHTLNFANNLWIWNTPQENHAYTIGIDVSSGEASDYSAIEVFDVMAMEQVAEYLGKCTTRELSLMADYMGRWYNHAMLVPERTGMGVSICQDLNGVFAYPSLFRKGMMPNANGQQGNPHKGPVGFPTTHIGKPIINRFLLDSLGRNGATIKSNRFLKQAHTYIHLGKDKTGTQKGTANDDLVIATGLALIGSEFAMSRGNSLLVPFNPHVNLSKPHAQKQVIDNSDYRVILPKGTSQTHTKEQTIDTEIKKFTQNLIAPQTDSIVSVSSKTNPLHNEAKKFSRPYHHRERD